MIKIDHSKLKEYQEDLESYEGYLPYILLVMINYKDYYNNLRESDNYEKVSEELYKFRLEHKKTRDENKLFEKDLKDWVEKNPQYKDLIVNG